MDLSQLKRSKASQSTSTMLQFSPKGPFLSGGMDVDPKRRILIVDDEPALRSGMARCCRGWGFEPDVAASAEEALALIDSLTYDFILTDLNMPGIGGQSLLERLIPSGP